MLDHSTDTDYLVHLKILNAAEDIFLERLKGQIEAIVGASMLG